MNKILQFLKMGNHDWPVPELVGKCFGTKKRNYD